MNIQMLDLNSQYKKIKNEIDEIILSTIESSEFINGKSVLQFSENLSRYLNVTYVIPCANGTDALQVALMSLGLKPGDEILVPAFTYVATAEVISLLNLVPILVDVNCNDFSIDLKNVRNLISQKTKAIVPVHLFGQCVNMEDIIELANEYNLFIVEDTAQALGARFNFKNGESKHAGTIGDIGTTSFFPSKNLGCFGDGGAIFTNNQLLAEKIKMICNHGQKKKYYHEVVGVNSRLDSIQASILNVKLKYLDEYNEARNKVAEYYDSKLININEIILPQRSFNSTHVFHQYTIRVVNNKRDKLMTFLADKGISTMIYYPLPLHFQKAYENTKFPKGSLPNSEKLCLEVLSLPIDSEISQNKLEYITENIKYFFQNELLH